MKNILKRSVLVALVAVLVTSVILGVFPPQQATAAPVDDNNVAENAEAWILARAVGICFYNSGLDNDNVGDDQIDEDSAHEGGWFDDATGADTGYQIGEWAADLAEGDSDDSKAPCRTSNLVPKTLEALGWENSTAGNTEALCGMGIWYRENGDSCSEGGGWYKTSKDKGGDRSGAWAEAVRNKYFGGKGLEESLSGGMRYWILQQNFIQECGNGEGGGLTISKYTDQSVNEDDEYKIKWYDDGIIEESYVVSNEQKHDHNVNVGGFGLLTDDDWYQCKTIADKLNEFADELQEEIRDNDDNVPPGTDPQEEEESCWNNSGPLAWLLCPVLDLIDGAISLLDTWVNNLLFIDANTGYASDGVREGNAVMRNIALLLLVPMMMFMVIGTALNFGPFDPYTVKKALPRMLVATMFIVLSLPICQFAVEVSNTVGQGIGNLIISATDSEIDSLSAIFDDAGQSGLFAGLLTGSGAAVGGTLFLTWGIVGSFALVTVVALLIAFVILVMRQVLVMVLIVLAPLAIIVWIFPGNDKLWGIWKGTFTAMLLLYPIIAIMIASGRFVASVVGGGN